MVPCFAVKSPIDKQDFAAHEDKTTTSAPEIMNHGPSFLTEPPHFADFTNNTGINVECTAKGQPPANVLWITVDGKPANEVKGVRPSNPFGSIVSRDVRVRGMVLQRYEIHVYDSYVIAGNTAVLKCHVPTHLAKYIDVIQWISNNTETNEVETITKENGHVILPNGDLHLQNVEKKDIALSFSCRAKHRLTNEIKESVSWGRLFVSEAQGSVPPRIEEATSSVQVRQGKTAYLPCVAQGYPVPNAIWFAKLSKGQLLPIHIGERVQQTKSALIIENTQPADSATYVCAVSNGIGNERQETVLTVAASLAVNVEPKLLIGEIGKPAVFRCSISGAPVASVTWMKNGRPLVGSREKSTTNEDVLSLESLQLEDRGMYQCIVKNSIESAQATAELLFGDISPEFTFTFGERTLQPGPGVSLQCISMGIPTPRITWSLDDHVLSENERIIIFEIFDINGKIESVLNISDVQNPDGGQYKCTARNKIGMAEHAARLNVYGPPFVREMAKISVVDGTNIKIPCPVVGHPITSITWEKGGRSLPVNLRQLVFPNGTLVIEEVQREADSGTYTCLARNNQGQSAKSDVDVAVLVPPKITPFSFQDELLREGARARLQCVVSEGDLPLAIKWLKDGQPIDFDLGVTIRDLDEFSSILTIAVVTSRHNGNYTCVATNDAASVQHTAELSVNVPPKIVPFSFQDEHLFEGMLVRVSCVVSRGDLPLTIRWEKDGHVIDPDSGITIHNFDEYSSVLSIDPLTPGHQGNYTCYASNTAATATHSAQLVVKVPPKWIVEPADTAVLAGNNVLLQCAAEGVPEPTVTWLKAEGTSPGDLHEPISDSTEYRLLHNRSLYIEKASNHHRGHYVCQAANGIGRDLSTVVYLTVNFPPTVERMQRNLTVQKGENIHLKCVARGDHPLNFTWHVGKHVVDPVTDGRYKVNLVTMPNETSSQLIVVEADQRDSTNFSCISHNPYGSDHKRIGVIVIDVPAKIATLNVHDVGNRSVRVKWNMPFDGHSTIKKYIIQYIKKSADWETEGTNLEMPFNTTNVTVNRLLPAVSYSFRAIAVNDVGSSEASESNHITMAEEAPSGSPQDVEVEALDTQSIRVTWKPPLKEHWNGKLRGYKIGYKEVGVKSAYTFKTLEIVEEPVGNHSHKIAGLKNFTKYSVIVQAYNGVGRGPASRDVLTMTSEDVPRESPQDLQCTTLSSDSILVSWQLPPPKSVSGILRGYKVYYKIAYDGFEEEPPTSLELTAHENVTLDKLFKFSNYSFVVLAYTKAGEGPRTQPVHCFTLEDDAPAGIRALRASRSSILVNWRPPLHANGNITHFTVYAKKLDEKPEYVEIFPFEIPPEKYYYEVTDLFWNWKYEFWVTASTAVGEGPASAIATGVPDGPAVAAVMAAFSENIITAWQKNITLSCLSVGSPVPDKTWIKNSQTVRETDRVHVEGAKGFLLIHNAQASDTGNYTCLIKNRFGEDRVQHVLRVLVPPATPQLSILNSSYNTVEIEWSQNGDGGQPLQGFIVSYKAADKNWKEIKLATTVTDYSFDELQCGTKYRIFVSAYNRIGRSFASKEALITTNGTAPEVPTAEQLIQPGIKDAAIILSAWKNDNCPIQNISLEFKMKYNTEWIKLVIPVAIAMGGLCLIICCMCLCICRSKGSKRKDRKSKERSKQGKQHVKALKQATSNLYVAQQQQQRSSQAPALPTVGPPATTSAGSAATANAGANNLEDLTPYATFQLVEQPQQGVFNSFPPMPTDTQHAVTADVQSLPGQYPRVELAGFRSPAKDDLRMRAMPTAPPLSDTSSVVYDNQIPQPIRRSPVPQPRGFPPGRIKGQVVASQPSKNTQDGEGQAVPTTETTFVFPNAPDAPVDLQESSSGDAQKNATS
uniref:Down syndrome cell adhesion molecule n=1 Tax=Strigamia maritima TaxID=126957 RepID=T1IX56_STRMM